MPEHTDTPKEKILVYIRAEKQKTLHRRQVCINDIASSSVVLPAPFGPTMHIVNIHAMRDR